MIIRTDRHALLSVVAAPEAAEQLRATVLRLRRRSAEHLLREELLAFLGDLSASPRRERQLALRSPVERCRRRRRRLLLVRCREDIRRARGARGALLLQRQHVVIDLLATTIGRIHQRAQEHNGIYRNSSAPTMTFYLV